MKSKLHKEHLDYIMFMMNHHEAMDAFTREMDKFIKRYIDKHPDWRVSIKPNKKLKT
jgi:hypothetical protein